MNQWTDLDWIEVTAFFGVLIGFIAWKFSQLYREKAEHDWETTESHRNDLQRNSEWFADPHGANERYRMQQRMNSRED